MPAAVSDASKKLRGTFAPSRARAVPSGNAPRLMRPIPAPRDLPEPIRQQWKLHMALVVASGRMSHVDLLAFRALCQTAHGVDVAHQQAMRDGPTEAGQNGEPKAGTAWRMWLATMAAYERWLSVFGLTPRARGLVPRLPAMAGELHVIEGGAG